MTAFRPDWADDLFRRLVSSGAARPEEIRGCSEEEIRAVEVIYRIRLPAAYRLWLAIMGQGAGRASEANTGLALFYPTPVFLTHLVGRESGHEVLPDKAFVFADDQSFQCWFFRADGHSENPEVFLWEVGAAEYSSTNQSLWEFLETLILSLAKCP
jgi:hypothetical protein